MDDFSDPNTSLTDEDLQRAFPREYATHACRIALLAADVNGGLTDDEALAAARYASEQLIPDFGKQMEKAISDSLKQPQATETQEKADKADEVVDLSDPKTLHDQRTALMRIEAEQLRKSGNRKVDPMDSERNNLLLLDFHERDTKRCNLVYQLSNQQGLPWKELHEMSDADLLFHATRSANERTKLCAMYFELTAEQMTDPFLSNAELEKMIQELQELSACYKTVTGECIKGSISTLTEKVQTALQKLYENLTNELLVFRPWREMRDIVFEIKQQQLIKSYCIITEKQMPLNTTLGLTDVMKLWNNALKEWKLLCQQYFQLTKKDIEDQKYTIPHMQRIIRKKLAQTYFSLQGAEMSSETKNASLADMWNAVKELCEKRKELHLMYFKLTGERMQHRHNVDKLQNIVRELLCDHKHISEMYCRVMNKSPDPKMTSPQMQSDILSHYEL